MGTILNAVCNFCGFKKKFYFGAGTLDPKAVFNVPAIDIATGRFVVVNYNDEKISYENIVFYNRQGMFQGSMKDGYHEWGDVKIKETKNKCPGCNRFLLDFEIGNSMD